MGSKFMLTAVFTKEIGLKTSAMASADEFIQMVTCTKVIGS
jgi:hypothetical protein